MHEVRTIWLDQMIYILFFVKKCKDSSRTFNVYLSKQLTENSNLQRPGN